ncbi:MAG: ExeM/NucH family extracellular endonuclease [Epsilonproteobacteria bacterium]|nr:ExeM/NucH family extracellular endonuclease [Campylobacterota bacterium]
MGYKSLTLSLSTVLILGGCGGENSSQTKYSESASEVQNSAEKVIKAAKCDSTTEVCLAQEKIINQCGDRGGEVFYFGYDNNENGILDQTEIDSSKDVIICNGYQGLQGETGADGQSISINQITNNKDSSITISFSDGTHFTTNPLKGADGESGIDGQNVSVSSVDTNADGSLTLNFSDGTNFTTTSLKGDQGDTGATGATGQDGTDGKDGQSISVTSIQTNTDGSLTLNFSDGTNFTTGSLKGDTGAAGANGQDGTNGVDGQNGADGQSISVTSIQTNADGSLTLNFSDGTNFTTGSLKGEKGDQGEKGDTGATGADGQNGTNGTDGQDGEQGYTSLITSAEIPAGTTCTNGGIKFDIGIDTNRNNTLDTAEIVQTQTICLPATTTNVDITKIHAVQGSGATSPMENDEVTVEAIVVADYQDGSFKGFYIQEEDADVDGDDTTSEGIFVYDPALITDVDVGDKVKLKGTVSEYYGLSQIKDLSEVTVVSQVATLPTAQTITLPMTSSTDFEKYEGMRVTFNQTLNVTEVYNLGKYGEILLSSADRLWQPTQIATPGAAATAVEDANQLNQIILDDLISGSYPDTIVHPGSGLSKTNVLRGGDNITDLTAVMSYGFSAYRLMPLGEVIFNQANSRPADLPTVNGNLKVASINVLNYFNTIDDGGSTCGTHNQGCRGADDADELARQKAKMLTALEKMDADVIGLMEIENDGGVTLQTIVDGLTGYDYVRNPSGNGSQLGTDVITVAMLYKTDKVELVGTSTTIDDGEYQGAFDDRNRKPLAQTFKDKDTNEIFTVVNNHLKSKGSGCGTGDDATDGQGNCNGTRTAGSEDLISWIDDLKVAIGDEDFLIIGDLNAYAKEDPITTLENAGYNNLDGAGNNYSYVYYGQWGTLDYALASPTLNAKVSSVVRWTINADESWVFDYNDDASSSNYGRPKPNDYLTNLYEPNEYRMSDHDPIVVGFSFSAPSNTVPTANAGDDQNITLGDNVTLDASGSSDSDGTITSYVWSEGGTQIGTGETLDKNDFTVGTHTVTLTVTDDGNAIDTDTVVITVTAATGASTIWSESFETDGSTTRYTASEECTDNSGDFFTRTDGSNIGSFYQVSGQDGSYYYAAMDTDGTPCTLATQTLTFSTIDISGKSNLVFKGLFAEDDDGTNQDWDADTGAVVEYQIDGGSWQTLVAFAATGGTNTEPGLDTNADGVADSTLLSNTFAEFSANITGTGSSLILRVTLTNLDAGDEDIAFDNFSVEGN